MKSLKLILFCFFAFCFSGCFELNEEIAVNKSGGGDFSLNMDMGKLIDLIQGFAPPEQAKELEKVIDTTIQMKNVVDTSSAISSGNKALLRNGSIRMQMNSAEKLLKINMKYPFTSMPELQKLYVALGESGAGMGNLLSGLNPGTPGPPAGGSEQQINLIGSYFILETKKNSISRKLDKDKYAKLDSDASLQEMKKMGEMGGDMGAIKINTVINLSAAAKKVTGTKTELSEDKKTITLKNNLMDIFSHPEVFEFSVEY